MSRPKAPGKVVNLGRVRYIPGLHSLKLGKLLERIAGAGQDETLTILQALLDGSDFNLDEVTVEESEDEETAALLDGLLDF